MLSSSASGKYLWCSSSSFSLPIHCVCLSVVAKWWKLRTVLSGCDAVYYTGCVACLSWACCWGHCMYATMTAVIGYRGIDCYRYQEAKFMCIWFPSKSSHHRVTPHTTSRWKALSWPWHSKAQPPSISPAAAIAMWRWAVDSGFPWRHNSLQNVIWTTRTYCATTFTVLYMYLGRRLQMPVS